jgi:hypothetical protein
MPTIPAPPRLIKVVQGYHGHDDIHAFFEGAEALVKMGANGLKAAGGTAAVAAILERANVRFTAGRLGPPCSHAKCKNDHSFPASTEAEVDASFNEWALAWVATQKNFSGASNTIPFTQLKMYDELGWSFPSIWVGPDNVTGNPRVLTRFQSYLKNESGLTTPEAFGAASWSEVVPITTLNETTGAGEEGKRIRFYWSIRFQAWDTQSYFANAVAAVTRANGGTPVGAYVNCNNFHGRLYEPLGQRITAAGASNEDLLGGVGATAKGGYDWFEAGRLHAGDILWTEDWFGDDYSSGWSFLAARLRCAARLGADTTSGSAAGSKGAVSENPSPIEFGGSIVPRAGTDGLKGDGSLNPLHPGTPGSLVGTTGLHMRALALVGHGAHHIGWFEFGSEPVFPGNCYSELGLQEANSNHSNTTIFTEIAESSRMIAAAEHLLHPGVMPKSQLAILYPRSAWIFDTVNGSDHDNHDVEQDQGETEMDYQAIVNGLFRALSQYSNIPIDFIDEDQLTDEGLK